MSTAAQRYRPSLALWAATGFLVALLSLLPDAIRASWSQILDPGLAKVLFVAAFVISAGFWGAVAWWFVGLVSRAVLRGSKLPGIWLWIVAVAGSSILLFPQAVLFVHYHVVGFTPFVVKQASTAHLPACALVALAIGIALGTIGYLLALAAFNRRSGRVSAVVILGAIVFIVSYAHAMHSWDLKRVLFKRTTLAGRFLARFDMLWDLDGDTFSPEWLGGGDPDDGDADIHPLTVWAREHPAPTDYGPPARDPMEGLPSPLNILLITDDTLRADHVGCYGYPLPTTPVIDSLAARGVLFERCIVPQPKTGPSLASLMTGKPPGAHNIRLIGQKLREKHLTLAEILAAYGYMTCGITRNGVASATFGFDQGFQHFLHEKGKLESVATDSALAWLETKWLPTTEFRSQPGRPPFFMWVHYLDPHGPYDRPRPYGDASLEETEETILGDRYDPRVLTWLIPPYQRQNTSRVAYYIAQYNGEISSVDREVGRLLGWLRARNLDGSTLVIFSSDHGESFTEHDFYFEHGDVAYDDNARVPLIFRLPGVFPEGRRVPPQVNSIDILTTITDLLDIPALPGPEGRSLLGLIMGGTWTQPRYVHILANYVGRYSPRYFTNALTDGRWKVIYTPEFHILELYDLQNDPWELDNLWGHWSDDPNGGERREAGVRLRSLLAQRMLADRAGRRTEAAREAEMSKDLMEQLRSLGYIN